MPSEVVFYKTARGGLRHISLNRASKRIRRIKTYLLSWICISYGHRRGLAALGDLARLQGRGRFGLNVVLPSRSIECPVPQSHIAAAEVGLPQSKIHSCLCIEPEGISNNLYKMKEKRNDCSGMY